MMGRNNKSKTTRILIAIFALTWVGLAASTTYLYLENQDLKDELALPASERTELLNQRLIEEVSEVFSLPEGEDPEVIFVSDAERAREEEPGIVSVFQDLQNGDYLLLYRKARIGVQYRPDDKKVVFSTSIATPVVVEVIGSQAAVDAAEERLADFGNQITIVKRVDESITQAFIFDVDDNQPTETQSIATQLDVEVGATLPASISPADSTEIVIAVVTNTPAPSEATENQ